MTNPPRDLFPRLSIGSILLVLLSAASPTWASTGSLQQPLNREQAHQHYRLALHFWGRQQGATLNEALYAQGAQIGERYCTARREGISHQDWISQTLSALATAPNLSLAQMQGIARFTGAAIMAYAPYHCPEQRLPLNQAEVEVPEVKNSGVLTRP
ncbi:MAG: hypothetical protein Q6L60_06825 [Thermostichus sp. HHBFW_bins_43]